MHPVIAVHPQLYFDLLDDVTAVPFEYSELIFENPAQFGFGDAIIDIAGQLADDTPGQVLNNTDVHDLYVKSFCGREGSFCKHPFAGQKIHTQRRFADRTGCFYVHNITGLLNNGRIPMY